MSRPENENPKELEKTARELRKHRPRPSEALVSRIERLAERSAARRSRPARVSRRRLVLALAAALVIAVVGAVVHGELQSSKPEPVASSTHGVVGTLTTHGEAWGSTVGTNPAQKTMLSHVKRTTGTAVDQFAEKARTGRGPVTVHSVQPAPASGAGRPSTNQSDLTKLRDSTAQITSGNRLAELRAVLTLKVANSDQLSQRTAQAMKIARSLSGYVVSTQTNVPSRGVATSYLVLKVPATRSQDALIAISGLGKILSQDISLKDVKGTVTSEGKAIQALKREIASLEQTLSQQTLTPQARSQLQIELARDRARLSSLRTQRTSDILRGRLATITLTLTTGDLPKLPTSPSRIHKAIDKAWTGLSSEISWAATGLIVASPFLLLAAVAALLIRSRRRREERRLLEK
jgi:protein-S-isoprenylcysteine O-methyltransferase Ste14/autonomous glycyl radical cofactor GrcA